VRRVGPSNNEAGETVVDHEGLGHVLLIMKETINGTLTNNIIVAINNGNGWHVSHPYYMSGPCSTCILTEAVT